jgi:hypothetical protein
MPTLRAVPIKAPFVDWILEGKKTWEIRSRSTNIRGRIGLIKSRSGTVVGSCEVVGVVGPLTTALARKNARSKMNESAADAEGCEGLYAWVLADVHAFVTPVPYKHPYGAITWVTLDEATAAKVLAATNASRAVTGAATPAAARSPRRSAR